MRYYIAVAVSISVFIVPWLALNFPEQADYILAGMKNIGSQLAAIVIHNPRTITQLQNKYSTETPNSVTRVRILLVPGHEPNYGGAEYGSIKERDLTVSLANYLSGFLNENKKYEVVTTRGANSWNPIFSSYFKNYWDDIINWQKSYKEESLRRITTPQPSNKPKVYHNSAPDNVAYRLYGITKWSNENNIDITIHIHFNDHPGHSQRSPGEYSGFTIYTPEAQYLNSTTTRAISETLFTRLRKYNPISDLPGESEGIVDERELISIGANNTADAASLLIEYGYIYETQFTDPNTRELALKDLAFQTYLGLEDFFNFKGQSSLASTYDTLVLPHTWTVPISEKSSTSQDVYALQTALLADGLYPPGQKSKNDCPRTGKIGVCTKAALEAFQNKHGITGEKGITGPQTVEALNREYGVKTI